MSAATLVTTEENALKLWEDEQLTKLLLRVCRRQYRCPGRASLFPRGSGG